MECISYLNGYKRLIRGCGWQIPSQLCLIFVPGVRQMYKQQIEPNPSHNHRRLPPTSQFGERDQPSSLGLSLGCAPRFQLHVHSVACLQSYMPLLCGGVNTALRKQNRQVLIVLLSMLLLHLHLHLPLSPFFLRLQFTSSSVVERNIDRLFHSSVRFILPASTLHHEDVLISNVLRTRRWWSVQVLWCI